MYYEMSKSLRQNAAASCYRWLTCSVSESLYIKGPNSKLGSTGGGVTELASGGKTTQIHSLMRRYDLSPGGGSFLLRLTQRNIENKKKRKREEKRKKEKRSLQTPPNTTALKTGLGVVFPGFIWTIAEEETNNNCFSFPKKLYKYFCIGTQLNINIYICIYVYLYTHIYIYVYIYTQIFIYTYIYIYTYIILILFWYSSSIFFLFLISQISVIFLF